MMDVSNQKPQPNHPSQKNQTHLPPVVAPLPPEQIWQTLPPLYRHKLLETLMRICRQLISEADERPPQQQQSKEVKEHDPRSN